jgi:hypothetical protein
VHPFDLGRLNGDPVAGLNGVRGIAYGLAKVGALGQHAQFVELGCLRQHHRPALDEVGLNQRALWHPAGRLVGLDGGPGGVVAVGRVAHRKITPRTGMEYSLEVSLELARNWSAASQRLDSICSMSCRAFPVMR